MKILAAHTLQGDIEHFVVLPSDGPPAAVGVPLGHVLTEVDAPPGITLDPAKPEGLEKLVETIRSHRVEIKTRAQLIKK